ncbi:MAG: acetyl-CoA synthetase [Thermoproteota archaeon]|jgi:acetyl-CoA synthetase (ADP-forming)|uniref:Acetyl-CoA synthetase n=1 Tax=Candidatus Methanodesulfokora washburnensis TaxID=2478471 RepID=A0A429GVP6_9CREN|nr:acetate--CoA ligase family protein [Candidatus Methanodesulfokores washburnensis]RSN77791.1 acetyl-CoA synthetase [Candidatus Methanodesulfokores washburnensis]RZN58331.1 MAG: acetyl-CoA synthetase [Candidatus Methanodesulfokores washburnensis]TDA41185.1 MAG: acetyl-CoA synthetase [Candidatus Korarchaeota archaeon]
MTQVSKIVPEEIGIALKEGRKLLLEHEAKNLVSRYGIPVTKIRVAKNEEEAVRIAEEIGFPVVLKIVSQDIVHKSDVGGVLVGIKNEDEVRAGFRKIMENVRKNKPNARIEGIAVQEYAPKGVEVIIGLIRDPQFGPAVMFGLGGIFVEIFKDVSFRIAPLTERDADEMIREIKGYPLLSGYRGSEPVDINSLKKALIAVGKMGLEIEEIAEMDLNPVMAYPNGIKVVDARILLR